VTPAEIQKELDELESRLERLRIKYDQYFMGTEKMLPFVVRKDVDRRFQALHREQMRNTGLRFKFQTLVQRFTTYQTYWNKIIRQIEDGTYRRDVARAMRLGLGTRNADKKNLDELTETEPEPLDPGDLTEVEPEGEPAAVARGNGSLGPLSRGGLDQLPDDLFGDSLPPYVHTAPPPLLPDAREPSGNPPLPPPDGEALPPPPLTFSRRPTRGTTDDSFGDREELPLLPPLDEPPPAAAPSPRSLRIPLPGASSPSSPGVSRVPPPPPAQATRPPSSPGVRSLAPEASPPRVSSPSPSMPVPSIRTGPASMPATPRASVRPAAPPDDESPLRQLYDRYMEARRQTGESTDVKFDSVAKQVKETIPRLAQKYEGADVKFDVAIKDGKAILRPIVTVRRKGEGET
jgi:hypothetical protein